MITAYLAIYLIGFVVTTIGALQAGRRPTPNTVPAAALAGLMWPPLLVGVVQLGAFVTLSRAMRHSDVRSYR
jgi:hypothetical protein